MFIIMKFGMWSEILETRLPVIMFFWSVLTKILSMRDGFWFLTILVGLLMVGCRLNCDIVSTNWVTFLSFKYFNRL